MPRFCPACGARSGESARFCPACGSAFAGPSADLLEQAIGDDAPTMPPAAASRQPSPFRSPHSDARGTFGDDRFVPGEVLAGRYRIVALAGKGGMGEVYRADDLMLGQAVALKFLPRHLSADPGRLSQFRAEVSLARQVSHPNVCRVHDIAEIDGHHFLSMEYVDGEDLASLLRRIGRVPEDKGIEMARQLVAGLAAAHDRGVLHRDLKPANVLIDGRGHVRIADFGLAAATDAEGKGHELAGTPAYMAPEQFAGKPASVSSDIYALGLVLYELFTGRSAFSGSTIADLARQHREATPSSMTSVIADLDPAIERTIWRCLEKDPAARPASALSVAASLPGGDALAAAIARGETPSPDLVAASGGAGTIDARVAVASLVAFVAAVLVIAWLAGRVHLALMVPLPRSPDVLRDRAAAIAADLGFAISADTSSGFAMSDYLPQVRGEPIARRRELLGSGEPPAVLFWYRQSPATLSTTRFGAGGRVGPRDPPLTRPGMVSVILDPAGYLREFRSVPPDTVWSASGEPPQPDWPKLLGYAGFDTTRLTPVQPRLAPPVYADTRAAWQGTYRSRPDVPIRVEAAALAGVPVFFRTVEPWNEPAPDGSVKSGGAGWVIDVLVPFMFMAMLAAAVLLAIRNLRAGRGDRRGAARVAAFLFIINLGGGLLGADHDYGFGPFMNVVLPVLAQALTLAVLIGAAYLALEPYVRRRWPHALVGWNRLLAGNWQDQMVGRDVFAGAAIGVGVELAFQAAQLVAPGQVGSAPELWLLDGFRFATSWFLGIASSALLLSLGTVLLLFVLALGVRRLAIAAVLVLVFFGVAGAAGSPGNQWAGAAFNVLAIGSLLAGLFRFGLLTLVVATFVNNAVDIYPLTFDASRWFAPFGFVVMSVVVGLAAYGAWRAAALHATVARLLDG